LSVPKSVHTTKPKVLPKSLGFSRYALDFDGVDDYVSVPDDPSLEGMGELTVSCWVYPHDLSGAASGIGKNDAYANYADAPYTIGFSYDGGGDTRFYVGDGTDIYDLHPADTLDTGKWQHLVCIYDGADLKMYLDGELHDSSNIGSITLTTNTLSLYFASFGGDFPFDGKISDVCIYDRALSAEEVRRNMLNYHNPVKKRLVGWWRLEEGTGLTAYDKSGNGNDGTLTPSDDPPTWVEQKKWEMRAEVRCT